MTLICLPGLVWLLVSDLIYQWEEVHNYKEIELNDYLKIGTEYNIS